MLKHKNIIETIEMIDKQHLDIRTITMGISLRDCARTDVKACCDKIYDKICKNAQNLVKTGEDIEREFGIPIVNKRISITPMAMVAESCHTEDYVPFAQVMDRAAKACGVNFIGGYSALVQKGFTSGDRKLIASIPEALATTDFVCSSINVGSTRAVSIWMPWRRWAASSRQLPSVPATVRALAAPSWWSSATPWRITPSWPAPSTVWARQRPSSTWACPAPAWFTMRCRM